SNVGIRDELARSIKGIKVNAVTVGDIKAKCGPPRVIDLAGIQRRPSSTTVGRSHSASKIGSVGEIGILLRNRHGQGILSPARTKALRDPGIVDIGRRSLCFFPDQLPVRTGIGALGDSDPSLPLWLEMVIRNVRCFRMTQAGGDSPNLGPCTRQAGPL